MMNGSPIALLELQGQEHKTEHTHARFAYIISLSHRLIILNPKFLTKNFTKCYLTKNLSIFRFQRNNQPPSVRDPFIVWNDFSQWQKTLYHCFFYIQKRNNCISGEDSTRWNMVLKLCVISYCIANFYNRNQFHMEQRSELVLFLPENPEVDIKQ